ncbi:diguanylate cyclase/phosphodiesterase with PAS/PAC sensor(s) [Pseudomonas syringae]|uniref:EAL domain-containing protein n=1 Tax=Pseudomonas syringae TaxID=317 RepID=UPI000894D3D3|nr:EAL domain-containing protein [Pseudomonas syringae]SDX49059.1 diguanylate cyclase/phosphodiesterase with PAS/PAC sensor(s) [Pseudomonas syringae]SFM22703.1 diguanylate cyclase/phosphodiesterase with PAS/PAC sensor(s) [Pseudomonas syringae]
MKQAWTFTRPRLLGIVWPFIAVALFQALLGCVSLYTMSAVRSYAVGESLWSKGQKDAIHYLSLYANWHDERDYLKYQSAFAVPQGGHALREALDRPKPSLADARAGIIQGGNHPDDVNGVIWMYLNFHDFSFMKQAIHFWAVGDGYLMQLDELARQIHARVTQGNVSPAEIARWRVQINDINESVTPAARAFSDALGEGSRVILKLLVAVNLITAVLLILLALLRVRRLIAQRRLFADALVLEKERAQITLESIGDGVISTDMTGTIVYMNPAAEGLTHWQSAQACGLPLAALFNLVDENDQRDSAALIDQILAGKLKGGSANSKLIQRLDGSTVSVALVGTPIYADGMVSGAVLVLHDMTQEHQYIADLSWQAAHDPLTGLVNRSEFERRLQLVLDDVGTGSHCLMFLDLDQFKLVNDTGGHAAGDELLRKLCKALPQGLREGDTLARLGGDEFGVLLVDCPPNTAHDIAEVLRQIVQSLHFMWKGRPFMTTVSIGLVHLGEDSATLEASLSAADMACYMAKEKGRNRVQVYSIDDLTLSMRFGEMAWIQRLRMAIEENRFCLYAQEIASIKHSGDGVRHIEILLRLRDESGRMVAPDSFIPAAERYGLMSTLDRWVVRNVFKIIAECTNDDRHKAPQALCAINLSGTSIGDDTFLEYLKLQFATYNIAPDMICFEITETSAIADLASAIRFINELKALGCLFSLDDFCSGMSSFAYLKHLPVDFLKIDGSFVKDMLDNPINRAMVEVINNIGHVMGKLTIAEFVETPQIESALQEMGVDFAQGYLIGRPELFTCESLYIEPVRPDPLMFGAPGTLR